MIALSVASLVACGGSSSDSDSTDPDSVPLNDATNLRQLNVTFTVPERLQLIGSTLTATVTAGGTEQTMQAVGAGFESTLELPRDQQLQVYVGVRRAEDALLLAAADTTAWLGEQGTVIRMMPSRRMQQRAGTAIVMV